MKRISSSLAALALLVSPALAYGYGGGFGGGGGDVWIVSGGTSVGLNFQSGSPSATTYDVSLGLGRSFGDFEPMVLVNYVRLAISGSPDAYSSEVDLQVNYVITGDHADAFYVGPRVGFQNSQNGSSKFSSTVFGGDVGKRFSLGGMVSYDPNLAVVFEHDSSGFSNPDIHFVPVQFTLTF